MSNNTAERIRLGLEQGYSFITMARDGIIEINDSNAELYIDEVKKHKHGAELLSMFDENVRKHDHFRIKYEHSRFIGVPGAQRTRNNMVNKIYNAYKENGCFTSQSVLVVLYDDGENMYPFSVDGMTRATAFDKCCQDDENFRKNAYISIEILDIVDDLDKIRELFLMSNSAKAVSPEEKYRVSDFGKLIQENYPEKFSYNIKANQRSTMMSFSQIARLTYVALEKMLSSDVDVIIKGLDKLVEKDRELLLDTILRIYNQSTTFVQASEKINKRLVFGYVYALVMLGIEDKEKIMAVARIQDYSEHGQRSTVYKASINIKVAELMEELFGEKMYEEVFTKDSEKIAKKYKVVGKKIPKKVAEKLETEKVPLYSEYCLVKEVA